MTPAELSQVISGIRQNKQMEIDALDAASALTDVIITETKRADTAEATLANVQAELDAANAVKVIP